MPLFKQQPNEPEPVEHPNRKGTIFSRRRSLSPEPATNNNSNNNNTAQRRGLFGGRSSMDSNANNHNSNNNTNGKVGRTAGASSLVGATTSDVHKDPTVMAAREKLTHAENAEAEADRALFQARAMVREAKDHVRVLEREAAAEAKRAKAKQATCRRLHNLAFRKSVWVGLLEDLRQRSILDSVGTPDLRILETGDLIKLVKRLITGPETWSPQSSGSFAEVSKEIVLHPTFNVNRIKGYDRIELLPSGRNLLVKHSGILECWDVAEDRLVWRHSSVLTPGAPSTVGPRVIQFAAEETKDSDSLVVMVCEESSDGLRDFFVEIVKVNVRVRKHQLLLLARVPATDTRSAFDNPVIHGALSAVYIIGTGFFILDWSQQTYVIFPPAIVFIPGHIILADTVITSDIIDAVYEISIIANDALNTHMTPLGGLDGVGKFNPVLPAQLIKLSTLKAQHSFIRMSVHASPVHKDKYRIWIYGWSGDNNDDALWCYKLSMPVDQPPQWRQWARYRAAHGASYTYTTYSGHTPMFNDMQRRIVPPGHTTFTEVDLAGCVTERPHTTPYSGAVSYTTDDTIVIQYFK
ncbi:hypothetical protein MSAN_00071200 [Mycena sanguinolenta]|uniref:Uncharacterized protein n=1 Tax=Mycena sanguinolenta TaxID=230812 RepID=A0A8H6ZJ94_9AGAR|nr:hypothetical protein MSAN_00071200 [Mycena sanguinolenta]